MMFVDNPWPDTTSAPGPSSDERRQRTRTWPCASSPADTALISYSVRVGCQPRSRLERVVDRPEERVDRAVAGRLGTSAPRRSTLSVTVPIALPPCDEVTLQPTSTTLAGDLRRALLDEREQVGVGDLLLRVGELDRLAVDRVERVALEVVAELAQLALQPAPAGQLADRQLAAGQPDRLRGHDLVGQRVLDDAVLVDARLVGEGVAADDRLVGLDREAGQVADQPRGRRDVLGLDAGAEIRELRRPGPQGHDDLLERRVAGALAEAVDRDLDLARAGLDRGERVGRGEPQVVVAVDADRGPVADEVHDPPRRAPRTRPGWRSRRCPGC